MRGLWHYEGKLLEVVEGVGILELVNMKFAAIEIDLVQPEVDSATKHRKLMDRSSCDSYGYHNFLRDGKSQHLGETTQEQINGYSAYCSCFSKNRKRTCAEAIAAKGL